MSAPWAYLEKEPAPNAPLSDNPSGMYCLDCRKSGVQHCSSPEWCGGMKLMRIAPDVTELRNIAQQILRVDGDRDEDNKSDLTVVAVCAIADKLRHAADTIQRARSIIERAQKLMESGRYRDNTHASIGMHPITTTMQQFNGVPT